jgi:serine/threonine-protein kinase
VPASIRQLLKASLQKDPRRRLHHMADVRLVLDGAFDVPAESPPREHAAAPLARGWKQVSALVALVAGVTALGAAGAWSLKPDPSPQPASFRHPLREERFTRPGRTLLAIAPDATLAYVADGQIYLKSRHELVARPIPGTAGEDPASPSFSPDGRSLAYWARGEIRRIPAGGGTAVPLARAPIPTGLSWGADGTIVYAQHDGIWRVTDRGTGHEQIVVAAAGERMHAPQTLPGGDSILFSVTREAGGEAWDQASIVVQSLRTGERTPVHRGANPRFVPATGHLLYVTGQTLFAVPFDPPTRQTDGAPTPVVRGIQRSLGPPAGLAQYALSERGALAYIGSSGDASVDLEIIARSGASRVLPNSSGPSYFPRMSRDGSRIAVQRGVGDEAEIWIYDVNRSVWQPLIDGARPIWNPITNAVTFLRDDQLWEVPVGGGPAKPLPGTKMAWNRGPYDWSPRGDVLLYGSPAGIRAFYPNRVGTNAGSGSEVVVAPEGDIADLIFARFSRDGLAFAFVAVEQPEGAPSLYVAPYPYAAGLERRLIFSAAVGPTWSSAGQELFVVRGNLLFALPVTETSPVPRMLNASPAFPHALSRLFSEGGSPNYDVTPDGGILTTSSVPAQEINVILDWVEDLRHAGESR